MRRRGLGDRARRAPATRAAAPRRARARRVRRAERSERASSCARRRPPPTPGAARRPATTADDARRQPGRGANRLDPLGRDHDHDPFDAAAPPQGPRASRRAAAGRRPARRACRCRPSAATRCQPGGHDHRPRAPPVRAPAQSRRGWAKIIRPATVWRTRVTLHVDLPVDEPGAALDHDHRPVVEEADALAGLLALLDDPDAQLLAGQDRRLHRVRQRVDVQDPDALELGDAVEVEVVRQDRPAARACASATSLASTSADVRAPRPRRSRPASADPSASGPGSRGRAGRGCGAACPSCRRCAAARRARTAARRASRRGTPSRRCPRSGRR